MNPDLSKLKAYPFERLAELKAGITPPEDKSPIALSIGAPKHETPVFIREALSQHLHELSSYPVTGGLPELRKAIANWLVKRFSLNPENITSEHHVLPVNGTREALFAFAQCIIDRNHDALVLMPNPFYQIYEGAALLAGAQPWFMNTVHENGFIADIDAVPNDVWQKCQLIYICTPGNPAGAVMNEADLEKLINLADQYDFVIASDECYSEIYFDENQPPPGLLGVAEKMGRTDYARCVVFHSLSKRSNAPGLRSGFVAGDADIIKQFLLYRTYHGCAMSPPVQAASIAAWNDDDHVQHNRNLYKDKFRATLDILAPVMKVEQPQAGFYLWAQTPVDDMEFTRNLFAQQNVTVLPGSFMSREAHGINPGQRYVRMALVASTEECVEAASRIREFISSL